MGKREGWLEQRLGGRLLLLRSLVLGVLLGLSCSCIRFGCLSGVLHYRFSGWSYLIYFHCPAGVQPETGEFSMHGMLSSDRTAYQWETLMISSWNIDESESKAT